MPFINRGRSSSAGFSLLEVLVAFAILAVALGVLFQVFATGLRGGKLAGDYSEATYWAEWVLAGTEAPLQPGEAAGRIDDRYDWRRVIKPYVLEHLNPERHPLTAFRVDVEVSWQEAARTRALRLTTLRLQPRPRSRGRP